MNDELPENIKAYACDVRDLLGLEGWSIDIKMADVIDDNPDLGGLCNVTEQYRIARILLQRGHTEAEYREIVMHEMLHVALSPLAVAGEYVSNMAPASMHELAIKMLDHGEERVVTMLARALVKGIKPPKVEAE